MDGGSWEVVYAELAALYAAELGVDRELRPALGTAPELSMLQWSRKRLAQLVGSETAQCLLEAMEDLRGGELRGTALPTDGRRSLAAGWYAERRPHAEFDCQLPEATQAGLREAARAAGCTYFAAVVAVLHAWQHHETGKLDLALMVTNDTRDGEAAGMVGSFIDDMVVRTHVAEAATFREVLAATASSARRALVSAGAGWPPAAGAS